MDSLIKDPRLESKRRTGAGRRKGFSLPEVVVAMTVASIALFALLATSINAYKINHKARLRDNVRAVLRTYADQFQRLSYSNDSGIIRTLFTPTASPTGLGLRWGTLSNEINYEGAPTVCEVDIGPPGSPLIATVTRSVSNVDAADGATSALRVTEAAGFMLRATFTVTYRFDGRTITQTLSTLRLVSS